MRASNNCVQLKVGYSLCGEDEYCLFFWSWCYFYDLFHYCQVSDQARRLFDGASGVRLIPLQSFILFTFSNGRLVCTNR